MKLRHQVLIATMLVMVGLFSGCGGGSNGGGGGENPIRTPVSITTTSLPDGYTGEPYDQTLSASGGTAPLSWSSSGFFPGGLVLNPSTGKVSGIVTNDVFGDVSFKVTDSSSPAQSATKIIRMAFHGRLSIYTESVPTAHFNAPYVAIIQSAGFVDSNTWAITAGDLPPGIQLANQSSTQVELVGTPSQAGTYAFSLEVKDNSNPPQTAKRDYTLVVDSALAIITASLNDAVAGMPYNSPLTAVNATTALQWSATGLPSGLVIASSTGTITGTTSSSGNFNVTVTAKDSSSLAQSASRNYFLRVADTLRIHPNVDPFVFIEGYVGQPYNYSLTAFGGLNPLSWSVISGTLPPGLKLLPQYGTFSGTPAEAGVFNFTVKVVDSATPQQSAQKQIQITIHPPELVLLGSLPQRLPLGVEFEGSVAVTGGVAPFQWSLKSGTLPPGLSLDPATGRVSGTPSALGAYSFVVEVTDSASPAQSRSSTYWISVTAPFGRNDTPSNATPIGDGTTFASMSPYSDPADSVSPKPDTDYFRILGVGGTVVKVEIFAQRVWPSNAFDPVLEINDANGIRMNACRLPGATTNTFTSNCLNDDLDPGISLDSQLEVKIPCASTSQQAVYAHVLDWRGDARPDLIYNIVVNGSVSPLTINPVSMPTCALNQSCSVQLAATGGTGTLTWSKSAGNLPPGVAISSGGLISGSPTSTGDYAFTVQVKDSATPAQSATAAYSLKVASPPVLTTSSLPDGYTGVPYEFKLSFTGGTAPYRWSYSNDELTYSFQVDQTGTLRGTPYNLGTAKLGISVTDANGLSAGKIFSLLIHAGPLKFPSTTLLPDGEVGVSYFSFVPQPTGGTPQYSMNLVSGSVPPGTAFLDSGAVIGTPTTSGTYNFVVRVTDSGSPAQTATTSVTLNVVP
jgi:hypothetical protein